MVGLFGPAQASVCSNTPLPAIDCDGSARALDILSVDDRSLANYAGCGVPFSEGGPERILPFTCTRTGAVSVFMYDTECDLDLFVIGDSCNPGGDCLDGDISSVSGGAAMHGRVDFTCQRGQTYYIVVEGYAPGYTPSACPVYSAGGSATVRVSDFTLYMTCDERCGDGYDNDGDGLADCADADCACIEDCTTWGDEDGNGLADCADPACAGLARCCDEDDDGYLSASAACGGDDCDDSNAVVHPGAVDAPDDGRDDDCDGVDTCWQDLDEDGFGSTRIVPGDDLVCGNAVGESARSDDCRDEGAGAGEAHPGALDTPGDGLDQDCDGVDACFRDLDGDGYGSVGAVPGPGADCAVPGWASIGGDCLDLGIGAAQAHPDAIEQCDGIDNDCDGLVDGDDPDVGSAVVVYLDGDGDGYGTGPMIEVTSCDPMSGYAPFAGDCDDTRADRAPGLYDVPYDGIDQDCSGTDLVDVDADGHVAVAAGGGDCNDQAPLVNPARPDVANGIDDDCDGVVDAWTHQHDDDGDGFTESGGDCDDADADIHPAAREICDGVDNDCDAAVDEGTSCHDDDGDGYTEEDGDCHDGSVDVHPGAIEIIDNGIDDDCDGVTDAQVELDADGDGAAPYGGDCDDEDPLRGPFAAELPNQIDDDCDGRVDEGTALDDEDGDGWSEVLGDCHDGDPSIYPGAAEVIDGVDQDCDGVVDNARTMWDADGDGLTVGDGDCDDDHPGVHPGSIEVLNGVDDDCDGQVDEGVEDRDGDGVTEAEGDCDDDEGWVRPSLPEVCDGLDNDCDGVVDPGCEDEAEGSSCASVPGRRGSPWTVLLMWPCLLLARSDTSRLTRARGNCINT